MSLIDWTRICSNLYRRIGLNGDIEIPRAQRSHLSILKAALAKLCTYGYTAIRVAVYLSFEKC